MPPTLGFCPEVRACPCAPVLGCPRQLRFATVAGAPRRAITFSGAGWRSQFTCLAHLRLPSAVA
eukprot:7943514-Alexandrium_andersonii.AAC.1